MNHPQNSGALPHLVEPPLALAGFAHGLRYPSLMVTLGGQWPDAASHLPLLSDELANALACPPPPAPPAAPAAGPAQVANFILDWAMQMQRHAGLPVQDPGKCLPDGGDQVRLQIPTMAQAHGPLQKAVVWLVQLIHLQARAAARQPHWQTLAQRLEALRAVSPGGSNVQGFIRAALALDIPFFELPGGVIQFGQGARARWLDSSFTDATSQIGSRLARNKVLTAQVLRQHGIPVPAHESVAHPTAARQAAARLGYPVVVKPADLDGGAAVAAGLHTSDEVADAFLQAHRVSKNILVEQFVVGRDYRLTVFQGELIWALERIPGGVSGDGRHSVAELIAQTNADPRRGAAKHLILKPLQQDAEALALLRQAGLGLDSIPAAGQFVRLRRAANVAAGGVPVAVFDQVHPDNRLLAIRAAAALRLDLAGIDLLIPDIALSWRETGGAICEVNAQPTLGQHTAGHLYPLILGKLVDGNGRIPVTLVLGLGPEDAQTQQIVAELAAQGHTVGLAGGGRVWVGGVPSADGVADVYQAGRMLMLDSRVGAVVVCLEDDAVLKTGLAFDRVDRLVLAEGVVNTSLGRGVLACVWAGGGGVAVEIVG